MMEAHGSDRCIIVGSSAHNEHTECLSVVVVYGKLVREMQAEGIQTI